MDIVAAGGFAPNYLFLVRGEGCEAYGSFAGYFFAFRWGGCGCGGLLGGVGGGCCRENVAEFLRWDVSAFR